MKTIVRTVLAVATAILLSGCVVVPAGPGYYRPHYYHYYGY